MTDSKEPPPTLMQILFVVACVLSLGLEALATVHFFGYMPDYFLDHGLNQAWIGGGSALGFGTSFFCTVFAVWLSQRIPSTTLLPVALLLSAAAQIIMGLIGQNLTGTALGVFFLGMRMVMGLADGFIQVTAMGSILRILPESQVPVAIGGVETVRAITSLAAPIFGTSLFTINGAGTENIAMPFAIAGAMMACCFVLVATTVWFAPSGFGNQKVVKADAMLLLNKPPSIALLGIFMLALLPMAGIEPGLEPYLTSDPINLSVQQVGLFFTIITIFDAVGAACASITVPLIGHMRSMYMAPLFELGAMIWLGLGPKTILSVGGGFAVVSIGMVPVFIASSAILLRICRTYDLDPKAYSEVIASMMMGTFTLAFGLYGGISGPVIEAVGFRNFCLIGGGILVLCPIIIYIGYSERVMGRKLAPAHEDTDEGIAEAKQRIEEREAKKAAKALAKNEKSSLLQSRV